MAATLRRSRASIRSSMSSTRQPRRRPSARAMVLLPAPMNPTRYSLSVFTLWSGSGAKPLEHAEEFGIGHGRGAGAANGRRPRSAERRHRERHRQTVVVAGVHVAAAEPHAPPDVEAVWLLVDLAAHAAEAVGKRRNAIAFLDAQLLSTADLNLAPVRGHRGQHRQFVDDAGHFV